MDAREGTTGPTHPTTKTAVLVIHGIGQQDPFETLDSFARGLVDYFREIFARTKQTNGIKEIRPARLNHGEWVEVALRLRFDKPATPRGLQELHLHEYYWAPHTQGRMTYRALLTWLIRTGLTPLRYLSQNLQEEWGASGGRLATVGTVFAREILRILLLYVPALILIGYLIYALATLPDLTQAFALLYQAWRTEPQKLPLAAFTIAVAGAAFLVSFMLVTAGRLWSRRRRLIQREAEIAWFGQAGLWFLGLVAIAAIVAWVWPIALLQAIGTKLSSWASARVFLQTQGWPVVRTALLFVAIWYIRKILVEYVGDIAVYVTADEKSEHYKARSQILKESTAALRRLLVSSENYDQVIVAGHSLGSVIAYDTINRVVNETLALPGSPASATSLTRSQLDRLLGLVTFGSPLDKIYYFFRRQVDEDQAIRAQTLSFIHGFRRRKSYRRYDPYGMTFGPPGTPVGDASSHPELRKEFRWLNVWAQMDPVSGFLNHYLIDRRDQQHCWYGLWGVAHVAYWRDPKFYRFIAERLL